MASFKHSQFCFVSSKRKKDVEAILRSMGIRAGTRWEVADDLTDDEINAVAERLSKAEHQARIGALKANREDARSFGHAVARDLAARMLTPTRPVLILIEVTL